MKATEKTSKKYISLEKNELSLEINLFFSRNVFFYLPKLNVFFGNWQQSNARAGQKKIHVIFW